MDERLNGLVEKGDLGRALELASARLEEARAGQDDAALAEALLDEARVQLARGESDDAVMTVDEAISRARRGCGPATTKYAEALELGAEIAAIAGMTHVAEARFRATIEVLEGGGLRGAQLANALLHHGLFRRAEGDAAGAMRAFAAVVDNARAAREAKALGAVALTEMGFTVLEGDGAIVAHARALGDRALELFLELGTARRIEVADAMTLVGTCALRQGEPAVAVDFLETACTIYERRQGGAVLARHADAARQLGLALSATGRHDEARAKLLAALELYREGDPVRITIEQELLDLARARG